MIWQWGWGKGEEGIACCSSAFLKFPPFTSCTRLVPFSLLFLFSLYLSLSALYPGAQPRSEHRSVFPLLTSRPPVAFSSVLVLRFAFVTHALHTRADGGHMARGEIRATHAILTGGWEGHGKTTKADSFPFSHRKTRGSTSAHRAPNRRRRRDASTHAPKAHRRKEKRKKSRRLLLEHDRRFAVGMPREAEGTPTAHALAVWRDTGLGR